MKKTAIVLVFVLAFSFIVSAHPPTDIIISFDTAKSMVITDIMHDTKNPQEHFIYKIEVLLNGKSLVKQEALMQTSAEKQSVSYVIPGLKAGDKVAIDADCNKYGDLTKEAVVTDAPAKAPAAKANGKKVKK